MTEIVRYESMDDLERLGKAMVASGYFTDANSISKAVVKVLAGREMGFGPIASMNGIHVIKGKTSVGANLMASAVKTHPRYNYKVKVLTDKVCTLELFEDGKLCGESTFTADDARKAGTQNMDKFPRNMLFARAMSNGVRWFCPDVFMGNTVYTPEELGVIVEDDGTMIDVPAIVVTKPEPPTAEWSDEADAESISELQAEADAGLPGTPATRSVMAEAPGDLPVKWPAFCKRAKEVLGYDNIPHIKEAARQELGDDVELFHTSGPDAGSVINAAALWAALAQHQAAKA